LGVSETGRASAGANATSGRSLRVANATHRQHTNITSFFPVVTRAFPVRYRRPRSGCVRYHSTQSTNGLSHLNLAEQRLIARGRGFDSHLSTRGADHAVIKPATSEVIPFCPGGLKCECSLIPTTLQADQYLSSYPRAFTLKPR